MNQSLENLRGSARAFMVAHPLVTVVIALVIGYAVWSLGSGIKDSVRQAWEDYRAGVHLKAAEKAKQEAQQQIQAADVDARDRQAEDTRRRTEITPAITRARRELEQARQSTRKAEIDYEKSKVPVTDSDTDALHERNCSDLRELYPGERIPFCDQ